MPKTLSRDKVLGILNVLQLAKEISLKATVAANDLKGHPAFEHEGLPELLRAQFQNAIALCVQGEKIWALLLEGACNEKSQIQKACEANANADEEQQGRNASEKAGQVK